MYRRWTPTDGWGPIVALIQDTDMRTPDGLAVDAAGHAHVVSASMYGLFYARQDEQGNWAKPVRIDAAGDNPGKSVVAIDPQGHAYIIWVDKGKIMAYGPLG